MRKYTLQDVVDRVADVYSIPEAALKARQMLADPNVEVDGLARVIGLDQGLTSKVLRIANSSFYGRLHPADTVRDAIVTIGLRNMQNVITAHVAKDFNAGFGSPEHAVWEHSLAVAVIAMTLAEKTQAVSIEDAMLGGILHDIGKTVLCAALPREFRAISHAVYERDIATAEAESAVFGFNHAHVGAETSKAWKFPPKVAVAVNYHHALSDAVAQAPDQLRLICLIDLADRFAHVLGFSVRKTPDEINWDKVASARAFRLAPEQLDGMREELVGRIDQERAIFD